MQRHTTHAEALCTSLHPVGIYSSGETCTRRVFDALGGTRKGLSPRRAVLMAYIPAQPHLATTPCAPRRPPCGMSGFWIYVGIRVYWIVIQALVGSDPRESVVCGRAIRGDRTLSLSYELQMPPYKLVNSRKILQMLSNLNANATGCFFF